MVLEHPATGDISTFEGHVFTTYVYWVIKMLM